MGSRSRERTRTGVILPESENPRTERFLDALDERGRRTRRSRQTAHIVIAERDGCRSGFFAEAVDRKKRDVLERAIEVPVA